MNDQELIERAKNGETIGNGRRQIDALLRRSSAAAEDLTKATHSMMFAVGSLQDALKRANAVEALVLLDTIEAAVKVQQRIESLAAAIESK